MSGPAFVASADDAATSRVNHVAHRNDSRIIKGTLIWQSQSLKEQLLTIRKTFEDGVATKICYGSVAIKKGLCGEVAGMGLAPANLYRAIRACEVSVRHLAEIRPEPERQHETFDFFDR